MSNISREELSYAVERFLAERDAAEVESEVDAIPYIQEGDVDDVLSAVEALGFQIVKA
jgi:hypothetical protein